MCNKVSQFYIVKPKLRAIGELSEEEFMRAKGIVFASLAVHFQHLGEQ